MPRGSKIALSTHFLKMDSSAWAVDYSVLTSLESNKIQCYPTALIASRSCSFYKPTFDYITSVYHIVSASKSEFWIFRARQTVKRVLYRCLACRMMKNPRGQQIEAPLPSDRVKPSRPFAVTGIDFAGQLYINVGINMHKAYISLFTCATTRAVHLELFTDMSTDRFRMALQRFVGRRGLPHTSYTDNTRTFHAANFELSEIWKQFSASKAHQFLAHNGIVWKFIAPRAAWWGGW